MLYNLPKKQGITCRKKIVSFTPMYKEICFLVLAIIA